MIPVDRSRVTPPPPLLDKARKAEQLLAEFFAGEFAGRIQQTARFDNRIWKEFRPALETLFLNKCAYCESQVGVAMRGEVEMFRPKFGAIGLNRTDKWPDHYWWLAYEWTNLYLSCQVCNFNKGSRFPVIGTRAEIGARGSELLAEQPHLLDPCLDDPAAHLAFGDGGTVTPLSERGGITIEILQLDREGLVDARRRAIDEAKFRLKAALATREYSQELMDDLLAPRHAYAAARRQAVHRFVREHADLLNSTLGKPGTDALRRKARNASPFISAEVEGNLNAAFVARQHAVETGVAGATQSEAFFFSKTQYITGVELENFRIFERLELRLPTPADGGKPWMVLLGENGIGKSTVLKAVALALMDPASRRALRLKPATFLRHGADAGVVRVHVSGFTMPFELKLKRGATEFEGNDLRLQSLLFAYGGTRLPAKRRRRQGAEQQTLHVENLFNPFLPLVNPRSWLLSLEEEPFGFSARAMKMLLMQDDEASLARRPSRRPRRVELLVGSGGRGPTLEELSDGYQSVVALASDLMQVTLAHWDKVEDAEGVVIIDEIDVHLHPRWKIEIISLLRRVFPRVQFLVTTHDPLCLMGTRPGEVHVLRPNPATRQVVADQVDVPPGATADHLLTGFWFGLPSTTDPETQLLLAEHRKLLREQTPPDNERRLWLEAELRRRFRSVADTSVDRVAQSVAAEVIQEDYRELVPEEREAVRLKILKLVRERVTASPTNGPRS